MNPWKKSIRRDVHGRPEEKGQDSMAVVAHRERPVVDQKVEAPPREPPIAIAPPSQKPGTIMSRRAMQRADLERLRRRLMEPCDLKDRDLLTLLSYAVGGDGDPIIGLLDDTRSTISILGEVPMSAEPNLLASLERRLAVAMELYTRATAED